MGGDGGSDDFVSYLGVSHKRPERKDAEVAETTKMTVILGDGHFFVGAEDLAHGIADFAESGIGFYGGIDGGH